MADTYKTGAEMHPTAAAKAEVGFIVVTVGDGYYEVYIDKKIQKSPYNGQTRSYAVAPGIHRVSVYSAGQMVLDETIRVPAEGVPVAEPAEEPMEEPTEEPAEEPTEEPTEEPEGYEPETYGEIRICCPECGMAHTFRVVR